MTAPAPSCPVCGGPRLIGHPGGLIECQHTITCPLGAAEDATRVADSERALGPVVDWEPPPSTSNKRLMPGPFSRPMTPTELTLLTAFGFTPTTAITEVDYQSRGIRVRTWAGIA